MFFVAGLNFLSMKPDEKVEQAIPFNRPKEYSFAELKTRLTAIFNAYNSASAMPPQRLILEPYVYRHTHGHTTHLGAVARLFGGAVYIDLAHTTKAVFCGTTNDFKCFALAARHLRNFAKTWSDLECLNSASDSAERKAIKYKFYKAFDVAVVNICHELLRANPSPYRAQKMAESVKHLSLLGTEYFV